MAPSILAITAIHKWFIDSPLPDLEWSKNSCGPPVVVLEKTADALSGAVFRPREVYTVVAVLRRYKPLLDYKDSSEILGVL
jgi:hypothetical protein